MIEKNEALNINDLDVQELENRLEMTMIEAAAAGWIDIKTEPDTEPKPIIYCYDPIQKIYYPCPDQNP